MKYRYLKVVVNVDHWDGAIINGEVDDSGDSVPFKNGDMWCPVIDLKSGSVMDWPKGVEASFCFKVRDEGSYYLLDDNKNVLASIVEDYVPDGLCHGEGGSGYGDYIMFSVDKNGLIESYIEQIDLEDWEV